jgi:diguanylate cyclase (GGDEF)-like protein
VRFKDLSIRYKLTLIMLLISSVVLLLSSTAFMVNELLTLQVTMASDLRTKTHITASSSAAALHFEDNDSAISTLKALETDPFIVMAQIFSNRHKEPFATYLRKNTQKPNLLGDIKTHQFYYAHAYLQYSTPIKSPENEYLGDIVVMLDRNLLYQRIRTYISIALGIVLFSVLIAFLLSTALQRIITRPILSLVELTHRVSHEKNYALRASIDHQDEIGILVNGFNEMLEVVEQRDAELEKHREHLEHTVANRTAELKKLNLKLTYQAYHDALTNLPNRALFIKRVEQAIHHADENNELLAVLFIDLDRFKYINDTLGHAAGDRLLQEVAQRLLSCTQQPEDTVARLGGDEFTLLLRNVREPANAGIVAEHIIKALTSSFSFHEQELYITPSIGISIYPKDGRDVGSLMKNADAGMYMAKNQGRNNYRFYTSSANAASAARLNMEYKLRQALEFEQFEVWYQPRFDIRTGQIVGAEALVRWRSPDFNLVPPAQFIPLAEDTGLIIPIGEWVLRTACRENILWQSIYPHSLSVSVNLSARQFVQEDLLSSIEKMIADLSMNPTRLELELTESLIMPNAEDTIETLKALKKLGMQISVDDFGTGYSSLSYLKRFPIDTLKIDQSFVRDIPEDEDDCALVMAIIAMAHNLKLTVVAEGVETIEQMNFLRNYECDYVQGYLFGKPMPTADFRQLLKNPINLNEQFGYNYCYPLSAET